MNQDILLSNNSTKTSEATRTKPSSHLFQQGTIEHGHHRSVSYHSPLPANTTTNNTTVSDKSSSFIPSNRRTLASELAANDQDLSASLITTTQPPLSFNHRSLDSDSSYRSSSGQGNGHNIWGADENGNTGDDLHSGDQQESGTVADFLDHPRGISSSQHHNHRSLSPGQYFGARSLPLESMGDLWQQPSPSPCFQTNNSALKEKYSNQRSSSTSSYQNNSHTSSDLEPLWQNFKALPATLHHRHRWIHQPKTTTPTSPPPPPPRLSKTPIHHDDDDELMEKIESLGIRDGNITTTSDQQEQQRRSRQTSYSLHPHDSVTIKCQISSTTIHTHDGHLTLTNNDDNLLPLVFSLFSANGNVTFDVQSGTVSPGETMDIWIRPRKRILHRLVNNQETPPSWFDETVALLIGQDSYRLEVNLDITIEEEEDDDDDDDIDNDGDDDEQGKSGDSDLKPPTPVMDDAITMKHQQDPTTTTTTEPCPFCLLETLYPTS